MKLFNKKQLGIIVLVATVAMGGLFIYDNKNNVDNLVAINEELNTSNKKIKTLNKDIALIKIEVETLIKESEDATKKEINKKISELEKQLSIEEELRIGLENQFKNQNVLSKARINELETVTSDKNLLSDVISQWRGRTANVRCSFSTGKSSGSGILIKFNENGTDIYGVLTNQHVMVDGSGNPAISCSVVFPDSSTQFIGTLKNKDLQFSTNGFDFGRILLKNPTNYIKSSATVENNFCLKKPLLGDNLIILGYPAIGSGNDVTATEGIISGFENNFYITSAKVEQGNSGGVAVLLKNNCLLGMPTFVELGSLESLARILKIDVLYK